MDLIKSHYRQYRVNYVENPTMPLPTKTRQPDPERPRPFTPQQMEIYGILRREFSDQWVDHSEFRTRLVGIQLPQRRKRKPEAELQAYGARGYWGRCASETFMNDLAGWKRAGVISTRSGVWFQAKKLVPDLSPEEMVAYGIGTSLSMKTVPQLWSSLGLEIVRHPFAGDHRYASVRVDDLDSFKRLLSEHNHKATKDVLYLLDACEDFEGNATMKQMAEILGMERPVVLSVPSLYLSNGDSFRYMHIEW